MPMAKLVPSKRSSVEPFLAMDVMSAAGALEAQGQRVIHMEVGQPGAPAPKPVLEAARQALEPGKLGYTEACGILPLRERISQHYRESYGVEVAKESVFVTTGSSAGFNLAFLAAFNPGDRVVVTSPGYPAYRNILMALGLEPVEIPVGPETRWSLTPHLLLEAHREKPVQGVLVASPANPTGTMMSPELLRSLAEVCDELGIWFISDEIYHGLAYESGQATALSYSDKAIVINSFSKYYCMTGWRIGWMILPEVLKRPVERIAQSLYISSPALSQIAAIAAFDATGELEEIKAGYAHNRLLLLDHLPRIGFEDLLPVDGAFYVYASVRRFSNDSLEFSRRMLQEAGVATTPGADFDRERGAGYLRFSFAGTNADMHEAMEKLAHWLR